MLSWHGSVPWHGAAISAVAIAIWTMALEVQLLGHPTHGLRCLCLLLFGQFLVVLKLFMLPLDPEVGLICY